ncbi:MAG: undecaprenyldiphospho-muramoylpentapeptide beta-N-acetylglucosaminyltransferase [Cyanobacteriota bacterium]|nr:undecaprenyldiphospho-muramoylpentapeptide beta-N-acetylglucosaminyltransferase [Cyanobacteriota bacterium]
MTEPVSLLMAASGTGGHLFPALALAQQLPDYRIYWLGTPDRLEQKLVPQDYPLHTVAVGGFQGKPGLQTLKTAWGLLAAVFQIRRLLRQEKIQVVCTTGGYIAGPTILAAKSLGIPVVFHESNFIPGKVAIWFGRWCYRVALGFADSAGYLPGARTQWVGTPVRAQFYQPQPLDLDLDPQRPLIVVVGGSQGALAVNQLVRSCVEAWVKAGAEIVHLTGTQDPAAETFRHPHYLSLPFYDNMAGLLQRATLAVSRAGAGTLTELAVTATPALLIPYPFAAEDHQTLNAQVFVQAGAALAFPQAELTPARLERQVLDLLQSPERLETMAQQAKTLAALDSAKRLAQIVREAVGKSMQS